MATVGGTVQSPLVETVQAVEAKAINAAESGLQKASSELELDPKVVSDTHSTLRGATEEINGTTTQLKSKSKSLKNDAKTRSKALQNTTSKQLKEAKSSIQESAKEAIESTDEGSGEK